MLKIEIECLSLPHSGEWLNCSPIAALGLRVPPTEFILMIKYRLGMEVFATEGPCPACHRPSDKLQLSVLSRAGATATAGYSASQAYERKMLTSTDACRAKASSFSPWLQRLLGAGIEVAEAQVRKLAAALARRNGQEKGEAISHTWSRLGVLLDSGATRP